MKTSLLALVSTAALAAPVWADIEVRFSEGAPKDRFTIAAVDGCSLGPVTVDLDLTGSAGALVFDVTGAGAGVEVFQPFQVVAGADLMTGQPSVIDGDTRITLPLSGLTPGQTVAFTIDVDDTLGGSEITVSGSEITGATVSVTVDGETATGTFGADGQAAVTMADCLS